MLNKLYGSTTSSYHDYMENLRSSTSQTFRRGLNDSVGNKRFRFRETDVYTSRSMPIQNLESQISEPLLVMDALINITILTYLK